MTEQRKLAAVMFTDIVGYTTLMSRDEQKALALLQRNRDMQKSLAEKHNGEFLKEMGDGTLLCFQSALDAVRCAMEIQKSLKDDPELNLRIGIHLGDIVFKDGDVFGDGVNVASRIEALAESGGICISEEVYRSVSNQPDINTEFMGEKQLKNVNHPVKIHTIRKESVLSKNSDVSFTQDHSDEKSIIVLPFVNISPDPDQEYFSDGLTEEIISDLSQVHDVLVISRNSAMTFKRTNKKTKEIAREVNVQYVLEGSVRKSGNDLRITAQLIDAISDIHLWADKYKGTLDDVFDIQEKVSLSIVNALKIKLSPEEEEKIDRKPFNNVKAYELHIKAQYEMLRSTEDGLEQALQFVREGLKIIGDNELLYTDMGQIYLHYIEFGIHMEESYFKNAEKCIEKVFSLNPNSPDGHYLTGHINRWRGNIVQSVQSYKKALTFDKNHFYASFYLSLNYAFSGKGVAAENTVIKLVTNDPLNPMSYFMAGVVESSVGHFDRACDHFHQAHELEPSPVLQYWYAKALAYVHRHKEAYELVNLIGKESPETHWARLALFFMYAHQREKKKALNMVTPEFYNMMKGDEYYAIWMAEAYALIKEVDIAINWLEEGIKNQWLNYPFLNEYSPFLENIRSETRFKVLMKQVKKAWKKFEV